jgi:hypothetical protein
VTTTRSDNVASPGVGTDYRCGAHVESLPSLFELVNNGIFDDSLVAVAAHVVGPIRGVESWDLTLYGEGFEPLTCDPFSFAGEFLHQGLDVLGVKMLGAAGFVSPSHWTGNDARTEYHATIRWMTRPPATGDASWPLAARNLPPSRSGE